MTTPASALKSSVYPGLEVTVVGADLREGAAGLDDGNGFALIHGLSTVLSLSGFPYTEQGLYQLFRNKLKVQSCKARACSGASRLSLEPRRKG